MRRKNKKICQSPKDFGIELRKIVKIALEEDCAFDDITSDLTIPQNTILSFEINPREEIIFCGQDVILEVFSQLKKSKKFENSALDLEILVADGNALKAFQAIARGRGDAKLIFAGERVILNLIQHLSGVATITNQFVQKLNNEKIKILDTRKTLPGLRHLQKHAVEMGGGKNHRMNLSDMILIKDNHIAAAGGVVEALELAEKTTRKIVAELECDNFEQVTKALELRPDVIMLDNMSPTEIKKCAALIRENSGGEVKIEISGGVNLTNIKSFSALDVDFISIGSLTHSVRAVDIGLDICSRART